MGKKHRIKEARKAKSLIEQIDAEIKSIEKSTDALIASAAQQVSDILCEGSEMDDVRHVPFGDILNNEQIQAVVGILNRTDIDEYQQQKLIMAYLGRYERELSAIGVMYKFLGYQIMFKADEMRRASALKNDPFTPPPNSQN